MNVFMFKFGWYLLGGFGDDVMVKSYNDNKWSILMRNLFEFFV